MFRSKSTVPFVSDNCYLTADVDNEQEYYTINETNNNNNYYYDLNNNTNKFNYLSNEFHLSLNNEPKRKEQQQQLQKQNNIIICEKKPYVGITPETRFRRTPTLDIIRSTKMNSNTNNLILPKNSLMDHYFHNKLPVAKF